MKSLDRKLRFSPSVGVAAAVFLSATACSSLRGDGFSTAEEYQKETGRQVYVMPVGGDLEAVRNYCIRVGSGPDSEGLGFNPLEDDCDTGGRRDPFYEAYSRSELADICVGAEGTITFVSPDSKRRYSGDDLVDACLTKIPIESASS